MKEHICSSCHHIGKPKQKLTGKKICSACQSPEVLPLDTPRAKELIEESKQSSVIEALEKRERWGLGGVKGFALACAIGAAICVLYPETRDGIIGMVMGSAAFLFILKPKFLFLNRRAYAGIVLGMIVVFLSVNAERLAENAEKRADEKAVAQTEVLIKEFVELDFYWNDEIRPWKSIIMEGVNRVHKQNPQCAVLDPGSADISLTKGSKENPVFFVMCKPKNGEVFNYFFSKSDVEEGRTFGAYKYIDQRQAIDICEKYARTHVQNPQTMKFSNFWDLAVHEYTNGRTRVSSSFKASNLMEVEIKFHVTCLFDANGLIEGAVTD
jgi:hypothetical protein